MNDIVINGVKVEVGQIWEDRYDKKHKILSLLGLGYPIITQELSTHYISTFTASGCKENNKLVKLVIPKRTLKTTVYWYQVPIPSDLGGGMKDYIENKLPHKSHKIIAKKEIELIEGEGL